MYLRYRYADIRDLDECRFCIRDGFAYDELMRARLVRLWREQVLGGAANVTLIEDLSRPAGERILWFCINVFVTDDFSRHLKTEAPPLVVLQVLRECEAGRSPLLTLPQLRAANAPDGAGVTMLTLNSGSRPEIMTLDGPFSGSEWQRVGQKVAEYSCWAIAGYHLNEALMETYAPPEFAWATEYGYRLVKDWPDNQADADTHGHPSPRLYSLTRADATAQVASVAAELFRYSRPCFGFTIAEQELLRSALFGETDEELAELLGVALVTVKKRWKSVYARAEAAMPALFVETASPTARRGAEKKRHLLSYLRHHLEELRPVAQPKR